jgi:RimJ/RimL family protein N-acetyltransferase
VSREPERGRSDVVRQKVLQTARIELIPLADDHFDFELELDSDPEVLRYLYPRSLTPQQVEEAHTDRMAASHEVPGLGFWVGCVAGEFVGWWSLRPPHGPDQPRVEAEADLGYRLLRRWWRQGLTNEGCCELLRHGFLDLGLRRIFAQTLSVNEPSRAVMRSIGMTYVRSFSADFPDEVAGSALGEVEYAVTRDEWRSASHRCRSRNRRGPR